MKSHPFPASACCAVAAAISSIIPTAPVCAQTYAWSTYAGTPGSAGSDDSPGGFAKFYHPEGITLDPAGNLFVTDRSNHTIRKVTPEGVVTTFAGSPGLIGTTNGQAGTAKFGHPSGVALDSGGNLYVADSFNNMIRKITPDGIVSTLAGQTLAGTSEGTGGAAQFSTPIGVAVGSGGNLFVADYYNHTIRKVTPAGVVTTFAGLAGNVGSTNGTGTIARFNNPTGIVADSGGNFYVTEYNNHTIRKITPGAVVSTLAGQAGVSGSASGTGAGATFYSPTGITVAPDGSLYVADYNNNTIRRVTPGGVVSNVAGLAGFEGPQQGIGTTARFNNPYGIVADPYGNLFVTDRDNYLIRKITPAGFAAHFAGTPAELGTTDSPAAGAKFDNPRGPSVDAAGNLYVADFGNHTIRKVNGAGQVSTFAGLADATGSTNGTGSAARFFLPLGTDVAPNGTIYVADLLNATVRDISPAGVVGTLAGSPGSFGNANGTGAAAQFNGMNGLAVDSSGLIYVADGNNQTIRQVTSGGTVSTFAGIMGVTGNASGIPGSFNQPYGVAVGPTGSLYVSEASAHTIRQISPGGSVSPLAGLTGSTGSADGTGSVARFNGPSDVATDSGNNVYVTDTFNHTVRKISPGGVVTTIGGVAGVSGISGGAGSAARFNSPNGIVIEGSAIYVTDSGNHRVVKGVPYGTPYQAWLGFHGLLSGSDGNEDRDRVVNLQEYAFGTHPRVSQSTAVAASGGAVVSRGTPALGTSGGYTAIFARRLDRAASSLTYELQFSRTLSQWFPYSGSLSTLGSDGELEVVSAPFPALLPNGQVPRFFRLIVSVP